MAKDGKWWRGNTREDFEQFLKEAFSPETIRVAFPECDGCGCLVYRIVAKPGLGGRRSCVACGQSQGICGFAETEGLDKVACTCGKNQFELAVAFAKETPPRACIARRCLACGILDVAVEWHPPADSTEALLDRA